ncbi:isoaspartyl peptidase/L-asparaginase family protein [Lewinella sp. LCG006]|uniref:isoaspartyl peptidase/L-asparaginase family protein n=1 Tax=Lewinella sp. LCG006 TaxID=3231911 RepID=UPI00345F39EA
MLRNTITIFLLALLFWTCEAPQGEATDKTATNQETMKTATTPAAYAIVIHGGAGTILRSDLTPEQDAAYREALNAALDIGEEILKNGGTAIDAVEQTIHFMEDSPLFNAGKGAVFNHDGHNEMDASLMMGKGRMAGAVGGVSNIKHPISAARAVMEKSPHVLLTGKGAETFAAEQGLEIVDPSYFFTQRRWDALQNALAREKEEGEAQVELDHNERKKGTVGCVALDKEGNIVAGTSTGGMTNKRWNRLGDSPIIGAGTFADNATCGVSCTGHGEFFIRWAVAYDVAARMAYKGVDLNTAADEVVNGELVKAGGEGGLIALDKMGNIAMPFNSEGMYRGYAKPGERVVAIYKE